MHNEIHIRSSNTGRYLNPDGSWSALRHGALQFGTMSEAKDWCAQEHLVNVEIVVVRDSLVCMKVSLSEGA